MAKAKCKNGCWRIFMRWIPVWLSTGHNIWRCSRCGGEESFRIEIRNPNKI